MTSRRGEAEAGYALLTAVVAMAMLATLSVTLIEATHGRTGLAAAEIERARLDSAADAGLMLAVQHLSLTEHFRRWAPDGAPHRLGFEGATLLVRVEDERGKVPINQIDEGQMRTLFATLGLEEPARDALVDAVLDWRDPDEDVRANGAERAYYAPLGRQPRNGPFRSLDELMEVRGMTPALAARLRPIVTVMTGAAAGFDDRYAQPMAVRAMGESEVTAIERERELAGQRPSFALNNAETLIGRPLTVRVAVRDGADGAIDRAWLIQLTGRSDPPFHVRAYR